MKESPYASTPQSLSGMPPGIPYIIGNEAAERFSFYGMRTILTVFMVHYLWLMGDAAGTRLSDAEATRRFHDFVSLVYLTPILGALVEMVSVLYYERRRETATRATDRNLRDAADLHRSIYQAIRTHDVERARRSVSVTN